MAVTVRRSCCIDRVAHSPMAHGLRLGVTHASAMMETWSALQTDTLDVKQPNGKQALRKILNTQKAKWWTRNSQTITTNIITYMKRSTMMPEGPTNIVFGQS
ncbi:hypothetical protein CHS0354_032770 [Potamilus streckersoni]|uniref:Uncharacterized protein n=1 Tax=Potamilus streckersoni TaxID=2493646 RepID=A0AAE0VL27_9BIVA|nr:hypothetical protein CHS0354_032770 [Potamilus streckersoni]